MTVILKGISSATAEWNRMTKQMANKGTTPMWVSVKLRVLQSKKQCWLSDFVMEFGKCFLFIYCESIVNCAILSENFNWQFKTTTKYTLVVVKVPSNI